MKLARDEVRHVAALARLKLSAEEEELFAAQLSDVLEYINQLNELDTDSIEPTSHPVDLVNVFREDEVSQQFDPGIWKLNAPAEGHGHFRVPKIIESEG